MINMTWLDAYMAVRIEDLLKITISTAPDGRIMVDCLVKDETYSSGMGSFHHINYYSTLAVAYSEVERIFKGTKNE